MTKTVAHFIRKNTQLRSSFIQNQILNHIDYKPVIIFKYESNKNDGGFAEFNNSEIPILNLWDERDIYSKTLYKYTKLITNKDVKKINEFLKRHKVDILHFHYGTDAGVYYPFLKQTSIPSVVSFYGYDCSGFPKRLFNYGKYYLKKRVFPYISRIFAMSEDMKNDLIKINAPEEKILVHYYGSDVKKFDLSRKYSNNSIITFLIISGLVPQKGHLFLLKSFNEAYKENKNIRLRIFGSGKLENEIKNFIKKNNMSEYVEFLGKLTYGSDQHLTELQNADVFIHPSVTDKNGNKEGIPGAIVEAMAAGLPIISTFHAGIPYVIEDGITGLLVNEWDVRALTQRILELAAKPELRKRIGESAKRYAILNLDLFAKEKELERIYEEILK